MIRRAFKNGSAKNSKINQFIDTYNLPRSYLAINRKNVSKGAFVGLFWAFIPMPMQMLAVLATTPLTRFNVPIAISAVWLSNPLTMPPMYYMEYLTGNFLLGEEGIVGIEMTVDWFKNNFSRIFIPLYVGTAFYSIVVSSLVYLLINKLWIHSVKNERIKREEERKRIWQKR